MIMNTSKQQKNKNYGRTVLLLLLLTAVILCLILGLMLIRMRSGTSSAETEQNVTETQPESESESISESESESETETESETLPPGMVSGMTLSFYHAFLHVSDSAVMPVVRMSPENAVDTSRIWSSSDLQIASVNETGMINPVSPGECTIYVTSVSNPDVFAEISVIVYPDEEPLPNPGEIVCSGSPRDDIQVIGGITYVNGIMIVNKTYPLPDSYNPQGMTPETAQAFAELRQAASDEAGLYLFSHSDFRSYQTQVYVYGDYANQYGSEAADTFSARAGYSEHQSGLCIDVNWPGDDFNDTPEAVWLEQNCARFGFVIRFPRDKEALTGYKYESWHIRYVGQEIAQEIMQNGLCLEEYLHVDSEYP